MPNECPISVTWLLAKMLDGGIKKDDDNDNDGDDSDDAI